FCTTMELVDNRHGAYIGASSSPEFAIIARVSTRTLCRNGSGQCLVLLNNLETLLCRHPKTNAPYAPIAVLPPHLPMSHMYFIGVTVYLLDGALGLATPMHIIRHAIGTKNGGDHQGNTAQGQYVRKPHNHFLTFCALPL